MIFLNYLYALLITSLFHHRKYVKFLILFSLIASLYKTFKHPTGPIETIIFLGICNNSFSILFISLSEGIFLVPFLFTNPLLSSKCSICNAKYSNFSSDNGSKLYHLYLLIFVLKFKIFIYFWLYTIFGQCFSLKFCFHYIFIVWYLPIISVIVISAKSPSILNFTLIIYYSTKFYTFIIEKFLYFSLYC